MGDVVTKCAVRSLIFAIVIVGLMTSSIAQEAKMVGADLFIDLDQYVGKSVVVTDCYIYGAGNSGAVLNCNGTYFKVATDGIDRESFRFFLKSCTGIMTEPQCNMPFLVTPTGQKLMDNPVLKNVKIAR